VYVNVKSDHKWVDVSGTLYIKFNYDNEMSLKQVKLNGTFT